MYIQRARPRRLACTAAGHGRSKRVACGLRRARAVVKHRDARREIEVAQRSLWQSVFSSLKNKRSWQGDGGSKESGKIYALGRLSSHPARLFGPLRALCLGFSLQYTYRILPRLTIMQASHRFLRVCMTFIPRVTRESGVDVSGVHSRGSADATAARPSVPCSKERSMATRQGRPPTRDPSRQVTRVTFVSVAQSQLSRFRSAVAHPPLSPLDSG